MLTRAKKIWEWQYSLLSHPHEMSILVIALWFHCITSGGAKGCELNYTIISALFWFGKLIQKFEHGTNICYPEKSWIIKGNCLVIRHWNGNRHKIYRIRIYQRLIQNKVKTQITGKWNNKVQTSKPHRHGIFKPKEFFWCAHFSGAI